MTKKLLFFISLFITQAAIAGLDDYLSLSVVDGEQDNKLKTFIRHGFQCELIQKRSLDNRVRKVAPPLRQTNDDNPLTSQDENDLSENRADFKAKKYTVLSDEFLNECSTDVLTTCIRAIGTFLEKEKTFSVELDLAARRLQKNLTDRRLGNLAEIYPYENNQGIDLRKFVGFIASCETRERGSLDHLQKKKVVKSPILRRNLSLTASADADILPKGGLTRSTTKKSDSVHYDAEYYLAQKEALLSPDVLVSCYLGTLAECAIVLSHLVKEEPFSTEILFVLQALVDTIPKIIPIDYDLRPDYMDCFMTQSGCKHDRLNFDAWWAYLYENKVHVDNLSVLYPKYGDYKATRKYRENLEKQGVLTPPPSRTSLTVQRNSRASGASSPKSPRSPRALLQKLSEANLLGPKKEK